MRYFIVSYWWASRNSRGWGERPIITNGEFLNKSALLKTLGIYTNLERCLSFTEVKNIEELRTYFGGAEDKPNYPADGYSKEDYDG